MSGRRDVTVDALGLLVLELVLLDCFPPRLLLLPTLPAGGDLVCHYPTLDWLLRELLPQGRLHGWFPGAYLGQPLLLYYFPLPFLFMAGLAPWLGAPVAFKLGSAVGALVLPLATWLCFRLLRLPFPAPLLGAVASFVFLFVEENPIWGGTLASTLTGEFAYAWGLALALVFLGLAFRDHEGARPPHRAALLLALVGLAHGYAVLWAGLCATVPLAWSTRPLRTLAWLASLAALGFGLAAFFLLPLLVDWKWTTPYNDPWLEASWKNLFPPLLWPLFVTSAAGLVHAAKARDRRLLLLVFAAAVAAGLAACSPALGLVDVRLLPFAQLCLCLLGAAVLGLMLRSVAAPHLAALALALFAVLWGEGQSQVVRFWVEWNYTGLQAKDLWPAWKALNETLKGGLDQPRVFVEYSDLHEKAGSIRMYETLPLLSGRQTLEGVYNQASLMTHAVYYVQSELAERSPNPFRSRHYATQDLDLALPHLRLLNVSQIVALSPSLEQALARREDVSRVARLPPYQVFRLKDPGPGLVEPLAFQPVRSSFADWRDKAYRWLTRKPFAPALLVFSEDARRFPLAERDEWLSPPLVPLRGAVQVQARMEPERISITTDSPGHPLLVKVSWHPRWKAHGADGPYLVSPGLMLVVPRGKNLELRYETAWSDTAGRWLSALSALVCLALATAGWRLRPRPWADSVMPERPGVQRDEVTDGATSEPRAESAPPERLEAVEAPTPSSPARFGIAAVVPLALLLLLFAGHFRSPRPADQERLVLELAAKASSAAGAGRCADAAEYAREALQRSTDAGQRPSLESLAASCSSEGALKTLP